MPSKERITITIDGELLRRLDGVCNLRGEPRSALIERLLETCIEDQEELMREMENPVYRAILAGLKNSPLVWKALSELAGESVTATELEGMQMRAGEQIERGRQRAAVKKKRRKQGLGPALG